MTSIHHRECHPVSARAPTHWPTVLRQKKFVEQESESRDVYRACRLKVTGLAICCGYPRQSWCELAAPACRIGRRRCTDIARRDQPYCGKRTSNVDCSCSSRVLKRIPSIFVWNRCHVDPPYKKTFADISVQRPRHPYCYKPAFARNSAALSVRSQLNSGSSRPKCPYAAVF